MAGLDQRREVAALVETHYDDLYRYACRLCGRPADAEDLTQQTFLTAQRKLDQLREAAKARAWLFAVLRNTYLKSRRHPVGHVTFEAAGEPTAPVDEPPDFTAEELNGAIGTLPDDFRLPLVLFYFEDLSYRDIAAALDLPMGTVMSRLSRAKAALRQRLSEDAAVGNRTAAD